MFWKFDLNTTSHVDKLLDKEDVTLRELLDEDDVLQECKAQNQKLLGFLCRQQCMEELVSLITRDPPLDMEEKVRFKYVPRLWRGPRDGQGCREGRQGAGGQHLRTARARASDRKAHFKHLPHLRRKEATPRGVCFCEV